MSPFNSTPSNSGYVDLQVNGYAGIDFNGDDLTVDAMHSVCQRMRDECAAGFLPTVITDELDVMAARLARLADVRRADPLAREMILGVHIEGPFISAAPGSVATAVRTSTAQHQRGVFRSNARRRPTPKMCFNRAAVTSMARTPGSAVAYCRR